MKRLGIILLLILVSFVILPNKTVCIGEFDAHKKIEKKEVTTEKKQEMSAIIELCGSYLIQQSIEKGLNKFNFDNKAKTVIAALNTIPKNEQNKASYIPKKKLDRIVKKLFGAFSEVEIGEKEDNNDLSNIYIRSGGLIVDHSKSLQNKVPYTVIKQIYQIEENLYQAVVECSYNNIQTQVLYSLGTYTINLKKGNNQYGYIVKNIVQGDMVQI